jgi:hypothetical protein
MSMGSSFWGDDATSKHEVGIQWIPMPIKTTVSVRHRGFCIKPIDIRT